MQTRRIVFALSVTALVAAGWLVAPPVDARPVEDGRDLCFDALAQPVEAARKAPIDPEVEAQSCQIYLTCPQGPQIQCSNGNNDCSSGNYWVECGGNRTYCPPCSVSTECKYGAPPVACSSQVGDCHVDYLFNVRCDGTYHFCGEGGGIPPE